MFDITSLERFSLEAIEYILSLARTPVGQGILMFLTAFTVSGILTKLLCYLNEKGIAQGGERKPSPAEAQADSPEEVRTRHSRD